MFYNLSFPLVSIEVVGFVVIIIVKLLVSDVKSHKANNNFMFLMITFLGRHKSSYVYHYVEHLLCSQLKVQDKILGTGATDVV